MDASDESPATVAEPNSPETYRSDLRRACLWLSPLFTLAAVCGAFAVQSGIFVEPRLVHDELVLSGVFAVLFFWSVVAAMSVTVVDANHVQWRGLLRRRSWNWEDLDASTVGPGRSIALRRQGQKQKVRIGPAFPSRSTFDALTARIAQKLPASYGRRRRRYSAGSEYLAAAVLLVLLVAILPDGHFLELRPGTALHTQQRATIPVRYTHPPHGDILSLSVAVSAPNLIQYLRDRGKPGVQWQTASQYFGRQTQSQSQAVDVQDNALAKTTAIYVALSHLGVHLALVGGEPIVETVPSHSTLRPGDRIDSIDGTPTPYIEDLYRALTRPAAGTVDVTATTPAGAPEHLTVRLTAQGGVPGLATLDAASFASLPLRITSPLPYPIELDTAGETGPSAGLAITLGLLDNLSPTPIIGDAAIAVTGTIAPDGTIGPIGGLQQKVALAEANHVALMLVPADETADAQHFASHGFTIEGVASFGQALDVLSHLGS